MSGLVIRDAAPADARLVHAFIVELAIYEKLANEVRSTPELIADALFCPAPKLFANVAEWDGAPAGLALWFYNFSTFQGRHGLYVEDLYVREAMRGHGIGKALLRSLARRCLDEGLARLEWSVLDWNRPAIDFYEAQGAVMLDGWTQCRVTGAVLTRLAGLPDAAERP